MCCNTRCISSKTLIAKKDHHDDSVEFIFDGFLDYSNKIGTGLTFTQLRAIAQLKANDYKIKKGQLYIRQYNVIDGMVYTFKTLPEIYEICIKHKLYCTC